MTIADILNAKGGEVITARENASLLDVASLLAERRIGAVLVVDMGGEVVGILSERDIVRRIAEKGDAALACPVAECMTRRIVSCGRADTVDRAMELMTEGRFRHLPVMEEGALVGLVSIGDVVKKKIAEVERDADELKRYIAG